MRTKVKTNQRCRFYSSVALENGRKGEAGCVTRISAGVIESFISDRVVPHVDPNRRPDASPQRRLRDAVTRINLGKTQVRILMVKGAIPEEQGTIGAERDERADGGVE